MKLQQILLLISFVGVLGATVAPLAPVVQTKQGKMVGIEREFEEEKVHIYQGVRYGKLADFFYLINLIIIIIIIFRNCRTLLPSPNGRSLDWNVQCNYLSVCLSSALLSPRHQG